MSLKVLFTYAQEFKRLTPTEFMARHHHPVLVFDPFLALDDTGFKTAKVVAAEAEMPTTPTVAPICKRPGANSFSHMITVGRAGNNDIEIKANDVSKFHAFFSVMAGAPITITDAGSSNGTTVRGEPLPSRGKTHVESGDEVKFGAVRAVFFDPPAFCEYLAGLGTQHFQ